MLEIFAMEAEDLLGNIETNLDALVADPVKPCRLWEIRRNAHTFKGAAGIVGPEKTIESLRTASRTCSIIWPRIEIRPDERVLDLLDAVDQLSPEYHKR